MVSTWVRSVVSLTGVGATASDGVTLSVVGTDRASEDFEGDMVSALSPCDSGNYIASGLNLGFDYCLDGLNGSLTRC